MFEDLIPSAPAATPAPPPGMFDDLIPAGAAGGGAAGAMSSETDPSVGSVLKQFAIGVPEGALGMAGAAADAMTMRPVEHAIMSALYGQPMADELAPSHGKLLHD